MAESSITRAYTVDKRIYGDVVRRNTLGLQTFSPTIQLDDGSYVAYFGFDALDKVADPQSKKALDGDTVDVPMDVRTVGNQYLTLLGIPAKSQEAAMKKWLSLLEDVRNGYIAQWESLDKSDSAAVNAFAGGLYTTLMS